MYTYTFTWQEWGMGLQVTYASLHDINAII